VKDGTGVVLGDDPLGGVGDEINVGCGAHRSTLARSE